MFDDLPQPGPSAARCGLPYLALQEEDARRYATRERPAADAVQ